MGRRRRYRREQQRREAELAKELARLAVLAKAARERAEAEAWAALPWYAKLWSRFLRLIKGTK